MLDVLLAIKDQRPRDPNPVAVQGNEMPQKAAREYLRSQDKELKGEEHVESNLLVSRVGLERER